jgi:hypothetical protein
MSYYLDNEVRKITSPIILCVGDRKMNFENGEALSGHCLEKRYAIDAITAQDNRIVITLKNGVMSPNPDGIRHADMGIAD